MIRESIRGVLIGEVMNTNFSLRNHYDYKEIGVGLVIVFHSFINRCLLLLWPQYLCDGWTWWKVRSKCVCGGGGEWRVGMGCSAICYASLMHPHIFKAPKAFSNGCEDIFLVDFLWIHNSAYFSKSLYTCKPLDKILLLGNPGLELSASSMSWYVMPKPERL